MVIAVIALLMAVLLPMMGRVRRQAQAVVCQAKLRHWGIGFSAYVGDHDGRMPRHTHEAARSLEDVHPWFLSLKAYTTDYDDMLLCPTARRRPARIPGSSFNPWYYHWSPL